LTPNKLVLTFRGSYVCANFCENRSRNVTVRVLADGQTHRHADTQTQTDFIICPMLYAIAMGQIISVGHQDTKVDEINRGVPAVLGLNPIWTHVVGTSHHASQSVDDLRSSQDGQQSTQLQQTIKYVIKPRYRAAQLCVILSALRVKGQRSRSKVIGQRSNMPTFASDNALPSDIKLISSCTNFRKKLKTHFFSLI